MKKYLVVLPIIGSCNGFRDANNIMESQRQSSKQGVSIGNMLPENNNNANTALLGCACAKKFVSKFLGIPTQNLTFSDIINKFDDIVDGMREMSKNKRGDIENPFPIPIKEEFIKHLIRGYKKDIDSYHILPDVTDQELANAIFYELRSKPEIRVNEQNRVGDSALIEACDKRNNYVFSILLSHPDIDLRDHGFDHQGSPPSVLQRLVLIEDSSVKLDEEQRCSMTKILLDSGKIDPNEITECLYLGLSIGIHRSSPAVIKAIISSQKADINARFHSGRTCLIVAVELNLIELVKGILEYYPYADLYIKDDSDKDAFAHARSKEDKTILNILLNHEAKMNKSKGQLK